VNHNVFAGEHRKVQVPTTEDQYYFVDNPTFDIEESGDYVMILTNCYDYGVEVLAVGSMEWKSVQGYLPGDMVGLMLFYAALALFYVLLVLWYYCGMRMFQDAAIPIQTFILATMILETFELFFRSLDLGLWNLDGLRNDGVVYACKSHECRDDRSEARNSQHCGSICSYRSGCAQKRNITLFGGDGCDGMGRRAR
jgi:hypothetical protein